MVGEVDADGSVHLSPDLRPFVVFLWRLANSDDPFTLILYVVAFVASLAGQRHVDAECSTVTFCDRPW
jgi:hypothetical protein